MTTADSSTQTGEDELDEIGTAADGQSEETERMCEGNSDVKFHPLVMKHKGVFSNLKGTFIIFCDV